MSERTEDPGYIVELEPGVWVAPWSGDPGRTCVRTSARIFVGRISALAAIERAREYRPFPNARLVPRVPQVRDEV